MNLKLVITILLIILIIIVTGYFYLNFVPKSQNLEMQNNYNTELNKKSDTDSDVTGYISSDFKRVPLDTSVETEMEDLDKDIQNY
ncbi:MAG: hypothetical protein A2639_00400 [Candidatus Staskawiczbacteria bacterium RIFCSPHIGHO2_01_FULL_34_27]|uniref:Uncharacterized protein n=1 Tax=Candidatus Staskawiczbacteria bacterium RIFCSPHIGHO2_01_FULL_34_27 TaxID=1802199 RepID=A0A1G2HJY0_9BACT|nr:MAG: hypothetical protein A2639_00400 [Candidatus Staskawiczbacteria bacterium RIFCSPHIGHO2_01_FULL_34_27]